MKVFTKESLVRELLEVRDRGWVANTRPGNQGGIGNTLEDLLEIPENNLPLPNASEWELKTHRIGSTSLVTMMHKEPSPTALRHVPQVLLPRYGWPHQEAGTRYPTGELSFRQTISALASSDRGFRVVVDRTSRRVVISFNFAAIDDRHAAWRESVRTRAGTGELNPAPYWGFDDLAAIARAKLHNCFYVEAEVGRPDGVEMYRFARITMLREFSLEGMLRGLELGYVYVDFDARTGHNHGTKFRLKQDHLPDLYRYRDGIERAEDILPEAVVTRVADEDEPL